MLDKAGQILSTLGKQCSAGQARVRAAAGTGWARQHQAVSGRDCGLCSPVSCESCRECRDLSRAGGPALSGQRSQQLAAGFPGSCLLMPGRAESAMARNYVAFLSDTIWANSLAKISEM